MPSWVVDWSNVSIITLSASFPAISQRIGFSTNDQTLNVRGRILDTIHHVDWPISGKLDYELGGIKTRAATYFSSFDAVMDIVTIRHWIEVAIKALKRHIPIKQVLARVAQVLDPDFRSKPAFADWFEAMSAEVPGSELEEDVRQSLFRSYKSPLIELKVYDKVRMNIFLDATDDKKVLQQHIRIIGRLVGQKLFITKKGFMGTCTEQSQDGDQIVALEGASFLMNMHRGGERNSFVGPVQIPIISEGVPQLLEDETLLEEIGIS
ncbi:hypothetical protein B0O99DRAFT_693942 [Bisporella sp. PMI_857]|nr:hypothetical protein B0O99DRAFT_693942 [Bisporella sp. PMI_857]